MKRTLITENKYLVLLLVLLLWTAGTVHAQCTSWGISAAAQESTCAANGKITLSFTGTGAGNVSNMLYSLEPLSSGGYSVSPGTSSVFENIPAGSYRAVAKGICNSQEVSATVNVTVPGTYVPFKAAVAQNKITLYHCNTGQAYVTLNNGKTPYTVTITNAPAAYIGRRTFVATTSFMIDSLWGGDYTLSVTDACSAAASTQTLSITELRQLSANDVGLQQPWKVTNTCNKIIFRSPSILSTSPYRPYFDGATPLTFSVSYRGAAKSPYRTLGATDTITLPAGKTFASTYRDTVTYYFRTPCGDETVVPFVIPMPGMSNYAEYNCNRDFNAGYFVDTAGIVCYPVYVTLKNTSTNAMRYDTLKVPELRRTIKNVPFGNYSFNATTVDGAKLRDNYILNVTAPPANPYIVNLQSNEGITGNDGAVAFAFSRPGGLLPVGLNIKLISSPFNYTYAVNVTVDGASSSLASISDDNPRRYFYPGSYLFRLTDTCGTYDIPVTVTENDVYRYTWDVVTQQTCTGLAVIPNGKAMYKGVEQQAYFQLLRGPLGAVGFDRSIVTSGDTLLLPSEGTYRIGMSAYPTVVQEFSVYGNGATLKDINFKYQPLLIDVNNSLGWICPGQPDNSGTIQANAIGGSKIKSGVYTYKLAAQGNGATGPYWAVNTTGRFSTAASGGAYTLMKDQNYDVRVEDECGSAAVQTLKIIDFETAELAKSDKPEYCIGESISFSIINLPTTAITYAWTGPDGFTSTLQNPVLSPVTVNSAGNYHATIYSDICMQPIQADVQVKLAPYNLSCYSAVTDTSVNPYAYSLMGNWRPQKTYSYYGARTESSTAQTANLRADGTIKDFKSFWQPNATGIQPLYDSSRWVWTSESTLFNKRGLELENKDPLDRFNAGIYGFDDALAVAVVQNSRYREAAYEGFEDYFFGGTYCDTSCSGGRSFDFSGYRNNLDSLQSHTGKYSLRIAAGQSAGIAADILPDNGTTFNLAFNKETNSCVTTGQVLGSIRTGKDAILPIYSPLPGKQLLVSAWVKEEQDCKGITYTGNKMSIVVKRGATSTTVTAFPKGGIIDGWQRYEQVVDVPADATALTVTLLATGTSTVYLDDLRIHPYNANMRSFVYSPSDLRIMAELDENNYATFYEYDDDGTLIRLKKETESGIKMLKESRNALIK
ncbi:hypothetical protein [Chitinophaga ginsengisoli]|uniref:YD repeat-containing protein n=1 Tax=Chitinophaga ginsengisoli TaxID=363837 RepID=A0A2P8FXA8_9BACT|nr:hypothetical protein [Chitinophaga ginsengisoli]PSL26356.1 hypothetical protein CLV42_11167 [Chitinophaga ginsengisoli]